MLNVHMHRAHRVICRALVCAGAFLHCKRNPCAEESARNDAAGSGTSRPSCTRLLRSGAPLPVSHWPASALLLGPLSPTNATQKRNPAAESRHSRISRPDKFWHTPQRPPAPPRSKYPKLRKSPRSTLPSLLALPAPPRLTSSHEPRQPRLVKPEVCVHCSGRRRICTGRLDARRGAGRAVGAMACAQGAVGRLWQSGPGSEK